EALQVLKFAVKKGRGLDFTHGTAKEDEIKWSEAEMDEQCVVPEDIPSFIASLLGS
ncbi:hypothetical protein DFH09DRAFT_881919, partial [Mycena vulgaris]